MKKHIELAKKWLSDDKLVTLEELKANKDAARMAYEAAWSPYWAADRADRAAARAAYWAYFALWAYFAAESDNSENAEYCKQEAREAIAEYEELTR